MIRCKNCRSVKVLDQAVSKIGQKPTGIKCNRDKCRGEYYDTVLDWEDDLPEEAFQRAMKESKSALMNLVLGSSLQIQPANKLPLCGKKLVILTVRKVKFLFSDGLFECFQAG